MASTVTVSATALSALLVAGCGGSGGDDPPPPTDRPVALSCEQMANLQLKNTTITLAERVPAGDFTPPTGAVVRDLPAFCRVAATIRPEAASNIRVEMWFPVGEAWNKRFLGTGNGAFGGAIRYADLGTGLRQGFATINTDQGTFPAATTPDAGYPAGQGHPERITDWGWRSTRWMTVIGKEMLRHHYAAPANYAYFNGCSTGGHQALSQAQKFPNDYDGILAGAPGHNRTHLHTYFVWSASLSALKPERTIAPALATQIQQTALAQCVGRDGGLSTDKFLTDPRVCDFQPASMQCAAGGSGSSCLTPDQVEGLTLGLQGPRNPRTGALIYPGWEPTTGGALTTLPTAPTSGADGIHRWVLGANWDWKTFDFDADLARVNDELGPIVNSLDADLSAFEQAGGKLLMYHGWADTVVVPSDSIFYYQRLARERGHSLAQTQEYAKLFMAPGVSHCAGGDGPNTFDALTPLVEWVENKTSPTSIVATKYVQNGNPASGVQMTRPLCPFPQQARYDGVGDPNAAASFSCADAARDPALFEMPGADYLAPLVVKAAASPGSVDPRSGDDIRVTVSVRAADPRQWQLSDFRAEGVAASSAEPSADGSSYVAVFKRAELAAFTTGATRGTPIDMEVTGKVVHNGRASQFVASAAVTVMP